MDYQAILQKSQLLMLLRRRNVIMKSNRSSRRKRRWGTRPVLRTRKQDGEFYTSFVVYKNIDPEWFFLYTRMTSQQFDDCLAIVGPALQKNSHREPLSPAQRLALTLRYLSQGDSLFSIASGYKIGRSTVFTIIIETTEAIWTSLNSIVLEALIVENYNKIANDFLNKWNLPHTVGAIDGKHIPIKCPNRSGSDFYNYKKHFSICMLAVCDANYNFTYVDIGAFGSQSDGGVLSSSTLGRSILNDSLPLPKDCNLPSSSIEMPYFFVGDNAFPLGKRMMKPFRGMNLTLEQAIFNYRLSRARRVIENAFGILVARWRIFTQTISANVDTVDKILKATVCLHNFIKKKEYDIADNHRRYCSRTFCDREGDSGVVPGEWRQEVGDNFNIVLKEVMKYGRGSNNPGKYALHLREKLMQYLISPAGALSGQISYVNIGKINHIITT